MTWNKQTQFSFVLWLSQRKTCTVVGGCGFLGRHLVESLLERGYQVNVFDLKQTYEDDRVQFFTGSINNLEVRASNQFRAIS